MERCELFGTARRILQPAVGSFIVSCACSGENSAAFPKGTKPEAWKLWSMRVLPEESEKFFFPPPQCNSLLIALFCGDV